MGKPSGKTKTNGGGRPNNMAAAVAKQSKPKAAAFDEDTYVFIELSQELKEEGKMLFQKRDHEGAMLKYEKALKLLPGNHPDVAYLRTNMAGCYMAMGIGEYPRAINECNLALQVFPRHSKALLKRAKCFEALNRLDLAWKDINLVGHMEPTNFVASEIAHRLKIEIERKGMKVEDIEVSFSTDTDVSSSGGRIVKERNRKKKKKIKNVVEEKKVEDKVVVGIGSNVAKEEVNTRKVKLVFGDDIRWAELLHNCGIEKVRDVVMNKFSCSEDVLIKYKDQEGDLVTITTTEELRWAEALAGPQGSIRLYVVDVDPEKALSFEGSNSGVEEEKIVANHDSVLENVDVGESLTRVKKSYCIEEWIVQFAQLFKNHVGFSSDEYLDLHEVGMKLYTDALEDTITGKEAENLFEVATDKFQEMTALALFNWGNVHMSRARKRVNFTEDASKEAILKQVKTAYEWAEKEYIEAGKKYEEALKMKPDFYEACFALGQQQFEQAKLSWCYAIGSKVELEWPSTEILQLFNYSEDNMEKGMQMWEQIEEKRLNHLSKHGKVESQMSSVSDMFKDVMRDETVEQLANMRSQINLLWGIILYQRSIVEFKLELPVWKECLEVAVEKFEIAGTSPTDIAVMIKNHCANQTAVAGLEFRIEEIVQAWNEMYDAKKWQISVPSSRLEPLFRRRVPKLHHMLEHI